MEEESISLFTHPNLFSPQSAGSFSALKKLAVEAAVAAQQTTLGMGEKE